MLYCSRPKCKNINLTFIWQLIDLVIYEPLIKLKTKGLEDDEWQLKWYSYLAQEIYLHVLYWETNQQTVTLLTARAKEQNAYCVSFWV